MEIIKKRLLRNLRTYCTEGKSHMRPVISREMRDINRTCILEYIRTRGKVSRTAIAEDLGLGLSSVVRITDELIEERLICLPGEYESSGGRRRPLIELDARLNVVVSIVVSGQKAMAALCSITGQVLERRVIRDHQKRGEDCVELIRSLAGDMYARAEGKIVRGISVGVPGIVLNGNKVMAAPTVGLDKICLAERLSPHFDCPVLIENDVNLEALGESWFGCEQNASNLVYIHIGTLLGMGIVQDRCVFRGAHHGAGELGYLIFNNEELKNEYPRYGALEMCLSGYGLQRSAMRYAGEGETVTPKMLFRYAAEQIPWAAELIDDFKSRLSMVIVAVATLLDPEMIVLGGGVMESAEACLPEIRGMLKGKTPNPIRIERSKLGKMAGILGGCASVLHHTMSYTQIKDMI